MTTSSLTTVESSYENINLNEVFNFSYNLNVFKQVIEAIAKNQKTQINNFDIKLHDMDSDLDFKING